VVPARPPWGIEQPGQADSARKTARCGVDTVEIARIERLLAETPPAELGAFFSAQELADAGDGPGRAASLAARFAAKEACVKLFPREAALGALGPIDFSVARDGYGAPTVILSDAAQLALGHNRFSGIGLSLTHDRHQATAMAVARPAATTPSWAARWLYRLLPLRRKVVLDNLQRVYGERVDAAEITRLAQAHYGHLGRLVWEFLWYPWLSRARKLALVRVENLEALLAAHAQGKGVLLLTGHFGNFEVATSAGLASFPEAQGRFHFVRRPIRPEWLDRLGRRRPGGFPLRPARAAQGRRARRVLRPPGRHLPQPGGDRAGHRRAGGAGLVLARTRRPPCAALRNRHRRGRACRCQRGHPPHHARLQPRAGAADRAPPRTMVVGAPALESLAGPPLNSAPR
jgi:phosphopantetheine--protein transferase-like protein